MPDLWLPGAYIDPGVNADYNGGTNTRQLAVAHFTVGADSRNEGRRGYFHWLVHRDADRENGCTQYAPIDAATWHAGGSSSMPDANQRGPGCEFERMVTGGYNDEGLANAEPLTQNQIEWGQRIVSFCAEWGIPIRLYDGPRFGAGGWSGWVNHHDLDKDRYDGLLRDEWMKIASSSPVPTPPKKRKIPMAIAAGIEGVPYRAFIVEGGVIQAECRGPGQPPYGLPEEAMNAISAGALGKQYTRFEFDTLILRTQSVSGGRLVPGVDLLTFKQP